MCDGRRYTHTPCRTHFFSAHFPCVTCGDRVHAWLAVFAVCMSHISVSPSPYSCFICRPCCSHTVTSTPRSRPHRLRRALPDPRARVERTSARAPGSLATWPIPRHTFNESTPYRTIPYHSVPYQTRSKTERRKKGWGMTVTATMDTTTLGDGFEGSGDDAG